MIYYLGLIGVISLFRLISLKYDSRKSLKNFYIFSVIFVILRYPSSVIRKSSS